MHPVTEAVYDFEKRQRVRYRTGKTEISQLSHYDLASDGLAYTTEHDDHPEVLTMRGQVLPNLGIQIVRFNYRESKRPHTNFDYYVDMVRVSERGEHWVVRDLYLDILVYEDEKAEIIDTDEYLAAIEEKHLNAEEAAYALTMAHTLLNGLAKHGYSLDAYLQSKGVTLAWPKLKSTH